MQIGNLCGDTGQHHWQSGTDLSGYFVNRFFVERGRVALKFIILILWAFFACLSKERMPRLMSVVANGSVDLHPLVTHTYQLDDIEKAYELFAHQRDGVMKVAIKTGG